MTFKQRILYTLENSKGKVRETFRSPRVAKEMKPYYEKMYIEELKIGVIISSKEKTQ